MAKYKGHKKVSRFEDAISFLSKTVLLALLEIFPAQIFIMLFLC